MKKSEAEMTWCPKTKRTGMFSDSGSFVPDPICCCITTSCATWEVEYEHQIHTDSKPSLLDNDLVPPEGEGWRVKSRLPTADRNQATITWERWVPVDRGECGLKSKEQGCFYPG